MNKAFVIGAPINHSRSPLIHNYWIAHNKLSGTYEAVHVESGELSAFFDQFVEMGFVGGNVTVPHKEALFEIFKKTSRPTKLTDRANIIGAINTLYFKDRFLIGDNTDSLGFLANLDNKLPAWDRDLTHAVIIGAGGASRAVLHALQSRNFVQITIANRTVERAENLIEDMQIRNAKAISLANLDKVLREARFLVNTSSLGMSDNGSLPFELSNLRSQCIVADIVYSPLQTVFLKSSQKIGCQTIDGLGMLLHQAVPGFKAWFGVQPKVTDELRQLVIEDMSLNKNE